MAAAMFVLRDWILLTVLHAHGESAEVASKFIAISIPANVPLAVGMTFSGVLRAVGDARRAMYVTLSAGVATAFLDPLLIFGLGLGVYGAAWATVLSRLILLAVGWIGAVGVHDLVARPKLNAARGDFGPIMAIGFPAIMANMAAPVSSAYTLQDLLRFRRAGDRRFRHHRSCDAGGVWGRFRPYRVGRSDHRPELWRETDGQGAARR